MRVLRVSHSAVVDAWRERERAIRRCGFEVHLLSALRWDEAGTLVELQPRANEQVAGVRTWGTHPALFIYDPRPLWRALGESWGLLDIHEEPFALATAEILLLRALRRQHAPFALYSAQNIDKRYPVPFRWFERWALRRASAISVCNAEAGRTVERKGFPGRAYVIPLGVDTAHFRPAGDGAPPAQRDGATIAVGYAGRFAPHKGVDVLLDAVAGDVRLRLRLAGSGPAEEGLRAAVQSLGISSRVEFLGSISTEDLPDFYRSLDVLAVPSLTTPSWIEQFGRVAVEAMACGVPVVASDSGALPNVVGGAGLLVPPGDAAALREALLEVALDGDRRRALSAKALERAHTCDWDSVGAAYIAMYRRALRPRVGEAGEREDAPSSPLEVVVVAYGTPDLLRSAITPLRDLPVTVVDNSSLASIREVCQDLGVRYLDPEHNGGFAAGVNHALARRLVPGGDLLLLNPDAVVGLEEVRELQRVLAADPSLASVGPRQVDGTGREARVAWPFPTPGRAWLTAVGLGRLRSESEFVIGSVLLLRGEALEQVGGFDERFFLYSEETDWAYRACRLGWRHAVARSASALHMGGATSSDGARREAHFYASHEKYYRKHFGATGWQIARSAEVAGGLARFVLQRGSRGRAAARRSLLHFRGPSRLEARYLGGRGEQRLTGVAAS